MTEQEHKEVVASCRARFGVEQAPPRDPDKPIDKTLTQAEPNPGPERDEEAAQPVHKTDASSGKSPSAQPKPKLAPRQEADDWRS